jgi:hypothetical protein
MRRILVIVSVSLLLLGVAGSALAQEPPPHDHWLTVPGTEDQTQVGPPRCELGSTLQGAFLNFHFQVHVGQPAESGGVTVTPACCP